MVGRSKSAGRIVRERGMGRVDAAVEHANHNPLATTLGATRYCEVPHGIGANEGRATIRIKMVDLFLRD